MHARTPTWGVMRPLFATTSGERPGSRLQDNWKLLEMGSMTDVIENTFE